MKKHLIIVVLIGLCLSVVGMADMHRQIWDIAVNESLTGVRNFHADKRPDMMPFDPAPDIDEVLTESRFGDRADNYYSNLWGWVTIPKTGEYTWHIHGDNHSILYISTDETWDNVAEVASVDGWSNASEWDGGANGGANTTSEPFQYKAGQVLAVWAIHVEGSGGDNLGIGWTMPGSSAADYITDYVSIIAPTPTKAGGPDPDDTAIDVPQDVILSWTAGELAANHDVYFGASRDDVNGASRADPRGVLVSQGQVATTYDPDGLLDFDQTYYWRIDEVNAAPDYTVFKGTVWTFTAEPFAYPIENITATASSAHDSDMGPEKTIDGSGLNAAGQHSVAGTDMWLSSGVQPLPAWIQYEFDRGYKLKELQVWNSNQVIEAFVGFGAKDVTVEYSVDGVDWSVLEGVTEFAQAPGSATYAANTIVDFGGAVAKFVKITINDNWGVLQQTGLSEVRFLQIPTHARHPQPADSATDVALDTAMDWRIGREAVSHDLYFSSDEQAVIDGTALVDSLDSHGYSAASLGLKHGQTYYWKVNEVDAAGAAVEGEIWDFATVAYFVVDDMESYNDDLDGGTAIFQTWLDGWENGTGSTVGYLTSPFAERRITNSGGQSMPLDYNNVNSPWYSETERSWDTPQNWTVNGVTHVTVNFRGNAPGFIDTGAGTFTMGAAGTDIWGNADEFRYAFKRLSGNGSLVAKVESLVQTDVWAKAGVMIRESLDAGSKHAFVAVTPASSVSFQRRLLTNDVSTNTDAAAGLTPPYWVKITRTGNTFTGQRSPDGVTWSPMGTDPAASSVTIEMIGDVYIGLAVTSHSAGNATVAQFSNVATTGNVTGSWQARAIGVAQPANAAAQLYVAVEDSSGKLAVVNHPDPNATVATTWQEWHIPLGDFTGVNMAKVSTIYVGVGDRDNPSPDGSGLLYIDDIRVSKPASAD